MAEKKTAAREEVLTVVGIANPQEKPVKARLDAGPGTKPNGEVKVGLREDLDDIRKRIKGTVAKTLSLGLNTPANAIVGEVMKKTGLVDEKWVQYTSIEIENNVYREFFSKIPKGERVLFIPHCLRDVKGCIAPIDEDGYHCKKCGRCAIAKITAEAERNGIRWYMCGGGSQVMNIIKKVRPKAVIGIACYAEIQMALEKLRATNTPLQVVLLKKSGCVGTEVDLDEVFAVLNA